MHTITRTLHMSFIRVFKQNISHNHWKQKLQEDNFLKKKKRLKKKNNEMTGNGNSLNIVIYYQNTLLNDFKRL